MMKKYLKAGVCASVVIFIILLFLFLPFSYMRSNSRDNLLSYNDLIDYMIFTSVYIPTCLYAFLGNRYYRMIKHNENKKRDFGYSFMYTIVCAVLGFAITIIPVNLISAFIWTVFCELFNLLDYWPGSDHSSPVFSVFKLVLSIIVGLVIYQSKIEKHFRSKK